MDIHDLDRWKHHHRFVSDDRRGENGVKLVVLLTVTVMVVEIAAGYFYGSMALLADGWHMGTHASALAISLLAYVFARKYADDQRFSFGTGKVGALAGFGSAIILAAAAFMMASESFRRVLFPRSILFDQAILVAIIGLLANLVSAYILRSEHDHSDKSTAANHHHDEHNLRAAYLHVLADALTSLLAILALVTGKLFGWVWMDPAMGIVGAVVILRWSYGLLRDSGAVLLDAAVDERVVSDIRAVIEAEGDSRVCDLHIWKIGQNHLAGIVVLVTSYPKPASHYKCLVGNYGHLVHLAIEVNSCNRTSTLGHLLK